MRQEQKIIEFEAKIENVNSNDYKTEVESKLAPLRDSVEGLVNSMLIDSLDSFGIKGDVDSLNSLAEDERIVHSLDDSGDSNYILDGQYLLVTVKTKITSAPIGNVLSLKSEVTITQYING